jgi:hypothetical protein
VLFNILKKYSVIRFRAYTKSNRIKYFAHVTVVVLFIGKTTLYASENITYIT